VKGVMALKGGIQAWVDAGYPLVAGAKQAPALRRP
jgi:rhodanese-related sulfurtransferase